MKKNYAKFLCISSLLALVACATNEQSNTNQQVNNNIQYYQCGKMQTSVRYSPDNKETTLTIYQISNGNVQAQGIALTKLENEVNETWHNPTRQVQWVNNHGSMELTYPVDGVVQFFKCNAK